MRCLGLISALILLAVDAFAADQPGMSAALLRTTWALLVVVGLILALYGLARKRLSLVGARRGSIINIVEVRPLMTKTTLALVEVRGRELLLGVSASGIHCLADLSSQEKTTPPPSDFEALLSAER